MVRRADVSKGTEQRRPRHQARRRPAVRGRAERPSRCHLDVPRRSNKQDHAKLALHVADRTQQRRLRHVQTVRGASEVQVLRDGDEASPRRDRTPLPPEAERVLGRGNTEGTPPRVSASTRSHSSSRDSLSLRGFRARGFPALPAVPAPLLAGEEGSTVRVRQRALQSRLEIAAFLLGSTCSVINVPQVWSHLWSLQVQSGVL